MGKNGICLGVMLLWVGLLSAEENGQVLPVKDAVFVAFDTETTGFSAKKDRVVEIGAVKFCGDGTVLASANWLINPQRNIPFYATKVHGITPEMTANAPSFAEVWPAFELFCVGSVLLAHNASFDMGFLRAELQRANLKIPPLVVADTLPLFRKWFPGASGHSLEKLITYLNVPGGTTHRAEADAFYIVNIFKAGMKSRVGLSMPCFEQEAGGFRLLNGR